MKSICVNTRVLLKGRLEGIGFHTLEILQILSRDHPEITFHFLFDRPFDPSFKLANNVQCHWSYPPTRHPLLFRWWFDLMVPRMLNKIKPDVFWSPDNFLSLRTNVPTVLTIHDLAYRHLNAGVPIREQKLYEKMMPRYIEKADHIMSVSKYTKEDVMQLSGRKDKEITVCFNGCRPDFMPLDEVKKQEVLNYYTNGHPFFLYLGSMHPRKNMVRLVEAFGQFKSQTSAPYKLILAGRKAWLGQEMQASIQNSPYKQDIQLIDKYIEVNESAALVGACFALMYVSLFEGFGIPVLEGLYAEVPVITSDSSSMPEVGGDAVLYADPKSIEAISAQMIKLYDEPSLKQSLVVKARRQRQNFSWQRSSKIVFGVLERYL